MNYYRKRIIVYILALFMILFNVHVIYSIYKKNAKLSSNYHGKSSYSNEFSKFRILVDSEIVLLMNYFCDQQSMVNDVFIIDHNILSHYIDDDDVELLIEQKYLPEKFLAQRLNYNMKNVSFGIQSRFFSNIQKKFQEITNHGWVIRTVSANGRLLHTLNPFEPIHLFFTKDDCAVQLVVFYQLQGFYWIGDFTEDVKSALSLEPWYNGEDFIFGNHVAIYDRFKLSYGLITMPTNVKYFIIQHHSSMFVECSHQNELRYNIIHKNDVSLEDNYLVQMELAKSLRAMKRLSIWLGSDVWMVDGLLLNWYQNCGTSIDLTNLNFAILVSNFKQNLTSKILDYIDTQSKFDDSSEHLFLTKVIGNLKNKIEYHFQRIEAKDGKLSKLKLHGYYYLDGNFIVTKTFLSSKKDKAMEIEFIHPGSQLCSTNYINEKMLIPCNYSKTILNEYGTSWPLPMKVWNSLYDPNNRVKSTVKYFNSSNIHEWTLPPKTMTLRAICYWYILMSIIIFLAFAPFLFKRLSKQFKTK